MSNVITLNFGTALRKQKGSHNNCFIDYSMKVACIFTIFIKVGNKKVECQMEFYNISSKKTNKTPETIFNKFYILNWTSCILFNLWVLRSANHFFCMH